MIIERIPQFIQIWPSLPGWERLFGESFWLNNTQVPLLFGQNIILLLIRSNPLTNSSLPASVAEICKTLAISMKMTSIVQDVQQKRNEVERSWGRASCFCSVFLVGLEKIAENLHVLRRRNSRITPLKTEKNTIQRITTAIWKTSGTLNLSFYHEFAEEKANEDGSLPSIKVSVS